MATEPKAGVATTQIHEIYIKASPEAIWDAITSPEWTVKYSYGGWPWILSDTKSLLETGSAM